jgi:hypothetical protein
MYVYMYKGKLILFYDRYFELYPIGYIHDSSNKLSTIYHNKMELMLFEKKKAELGEEDTPYTNIYGHTDDFDPLEDMTQTITYAGDIQYNASKTFIKQTEDKNILQTWSRNISTLLGREVNLTFYMTSDGERLNGKSSEFIIDAHYFDMEKILIVIIKIGDDKYVPYYMNILSEDDADYLNVLVKKLFR